MSEWISVEDRLPEINEEVLIYPSGWIMCGSFDGETWVDEDRVNPVFHVTYWMPLPMPPKEE
jgi:hypothetical protein